MTVRDVISVENAEKESMLSAMRWRELPRLEQSTKRVAQKATLL